MKIRHTITLQSQEDFQREIASFSAALDWSWEHGFQPIFIPMNTFGEDDDRKAAYLSVEKAKYGQNALIIDQEIRPHDAVRILNECQASFSASVHGSIQSAICNCPVMMCAFQPKHEGIMFEMELQAFILKPENASSEATRLLLEGWLQIVIRSVKTCEQPYALLMLQPGFLYNF